MITVITILLRSRCVFFGAAICETRTKEKRNRRNKALILWSRQWKRLLTQQWGVGLLKHLVSVSWGFSGLASLWRFCTTLDVEETSLTCDHEIYSGASLVWVPPKEGIIFRSPHIMFIALATWILPNYCDAAMPRGLLAVIHGPMMHTDSYCNLEFYHARRIVIERK